MALPKSTYVMGVVTLGLFGIAIYETKGGKPERHHADYDDDDTDGEDEVDGDEAYAEYQKAEAERALREAKDAAQKAQEREARRAELRALFGAEVAQPGQLFRGVALDDRPPVHADVIRGFQAFMAKTGAYIVTGSQNRVDRFEIQPGMTLDRESHAAMCSTLRDELQTAWGSPYVDDKQVLLWTNTLSGIRASFSQDTDCTLVFERYDEPEAWIRASGASTIPLSWLGKPAAFVEEAVGEKSNGETIKWLAHGVGAGAEQTTIDAWVSKGKISHIIATTSFNTPTRAALEEHLRAAFGKPKNVDDALGRDVRLEWPARKLVVVLSDTSVAVMVGTP